MSSVFFLKVFAFRGLAAGRSGPALFERSVIRQTSNSNTNDPSDHKVILQS